jgi:ribosome biogenesis protein YTM1
MESSSNSSGQHLISASHDGTANIIEIPELDSQMDQEPARHLASLRLHTSPLSSVKANSQGTHILTAGWDGLLGVFSTEIPMEDEVSVEDTSVSRKKRRKVEPSAPKAKLKVASMLHPV